MKDQTALKAKLRKSVAKIKIHKRGTPEGDKQRAEFAARRCVRPENL